jgi:hypothetical protein
MNDARITVPIASLDLRESRKYWPRVEPDKERIREFRELFEAGSTDVPPIVVTAHPKRQGAFLLVDGWHRVAALKAAKMDAALADLLPPGTDVFAEAVKRTAISTKPLSRQEKRAAAKRLLKEHPDWSERAIARAAGVSHTFVSNLSPGSGNVATSHEPTDDGHVGTGELYDAFSTSGPQEDFYRAFSLPFAKQARKDLLTVEGLERGAIKLLVDPKEYKGRRAQQLGQQLAASLLAEAKPKDRSRLLQNMTWLANVLDALLDAAEGVAQQQAH